MQIKSIYGCQNAYFVLNVVVLHRFVDITKEKCVNKKQRKMKINNALKPKHLKNGFKYDILYTGGGCYEEIICAE